MGAEEKVASLVAVKNISGRDQWYGRYKLPEGKWVSVPESLAERLMGDPNYHVDGIGSEVSGYPSVLLVTSNDTFYSGGRYYNYQLAVNLARCGCKVTISTNRFPCFANDFAEYDTAGHIRWMFREPMPGDGPFDLVIGTPFYDTVIAQTFAEKEGIPCAAVIYETPDWLHQYQPDNLQFRTQTTGKEVDSLKKCDWIIAISEMCKRYAHEWLGTPLDRIVVVEPGINHKAADAVEPMGREGGRPLVVYAGRLDARKNWEQFFSTCASAEEPFDVAIVGGNPAIQQIPNFNNERHTFTWHNKVDDFEKFSVLKSAGIVVVPSKFEGYGIVPGEALYCGKPCVVFDLPILREVYGEQLVYAKWMDWTDLLAKMLEAMRRKPTPINEAFRLADTYKYTMDAQKRTLRHLPCIPFKYRHPSDIKFSFCMIALNVEEFILPCLESVYDEAHEIIIVEGCIDKFKDDATPEGYSTDGTHEKILSFPDPKGKIKYSYGKFPTKLEMRQETVRQITGTHYWLLDPDEIYTADGIAAMRQAIFENQGKEVFHTFPMHFWHDAWHYATGGIWDTRHLRVCEWKPGHQYLHHTNPADKDGVYVHELQEKYAPLSMRVDDCIRYHYGMARLNTEEMRKKIEFYRWRDSETNPVDVQQKCEWYDWKEGMAMTSGVVIRRFCGKHPELVAQMLAGRGVTEPAWRKGGRP